MPHPLFFISFSFFPFTFTFFTFLSFLNSLIILFLTARQTFPLDTYSHPLVYLLCIFLMYLFLIFKLLLF